MRDGYGTLVGDVVEVAHDDPAALATALDGLGGRAAAFIGEPMIGAGGAIPPPDGYWPAVERICRERDVLLICRRGHLRLRAARRVVRLRALRLHAGPDDLREGHQLRLRPAQRGHRPGACGSPSGADAAPFLHGGTYAGHPGACVAGLVNIDIIEREGLSNARRSSSPSSRSARAAARSGGSRRRASAGLAGRSSSTATGRRESARRAAVVAARRHGVLTRALRGIALQISPPFVVTEDELATIVEAVRAGVRAAVSATRAG